MDGDGGLTDALCFEDIGGKFNCDRLEPADVTTWDFP